ncbi:putative NADH-dependent flavin oxidoreductase YqiG [Aeromicrobium flavum]|uniref:Putative NADH-dependent flavin oxidoreductase YqiG n=1 Tax=Aeromicrobium flavum TaxID=416568 RepID=A0A512HV83_9ACTN|nr:NADH:flavin oxidoreductase [Aeromicrobium flavum]GEO89351.1 putative NADH-dependent flavin oxidoreductase YqiG [Aeromicrobium flavum]
MPNSPAAAPLTLAHGPRWPNRWTLAPLTNKQSHSDGVLSDDEYAWLVARARGGFGLVMTCAAYVSPEGQAWDGQLGISDDRHEPGLRRLAGGIRELGAVSSIQLHHGGMRADSRLTGTPAVAPWADPERGVEALSTADVQRVIDDFVAAAVRAEQVGFDGVEVHGAHGYVLCQFLDARKNHRTDGYGGSLEERSRPLREVLSGIRAATGPDFQVGVRVSPEGYGISIDDATTLVEQLMASGDVDYLDLSLWDVTKEPREPAASGLLIDQFVDLPRHGTRLGVAGKILSAQDADWCLERGADFVTVGTAAIIHHDFPRRAAESASFVSEPQPFPRERLEQEDLGPAFIDYLADNWDDFVA